jgi:hypothetical protein
MMLTWLLFFAPTHVDKKMLSVLNGQERTITQFRDLLNRAGWKSLLYIMIRCQREGTKR